jgi:hypothetical protein
VAVNLALAAAVTGHALLRRRRAAAAGRAPWPWRRRRAWRRPAPALVALALLAAVALAWLAAAVWLLPPRGIDDINYHLPPLYRALQTGRLELLPMAIREGFALPLDADLLFLWPMLLMGHDRLIDAAQVVATAAGVVVLYALAKRLGARRPDAAVTALAFPFVPVVLAQAGSNYIDVIVAVVHFTLLYAALRFWRTGATLHLVVAGWATGFALGAKYTMFPLVAVLQLLVLGGLLVHRHRAVLRYALYWACALPLSAWWYLRNWRAFGEPMYPFRITPGGLSGAPGSRMEATLANSGPTALENFAKHPVDALLYPLQDPGIGSLHGGFGVLFWGLGTPALAWCVARAVGAARRGDWLPLAFWAQPLAAFALYIATVNRDGLQWDQRYVLAVTGLALVALALLLRELRRGLPGAVPVLRAACVGASALALVHLGASVVPHYQVAAAAADRAAGTDTSDRRYFNAYTGFVGELGAAWDPLDYLTRGGPGMSVVIALPYLAYSIAPAFGSEAQNRLLDLEPGNAEEPDAVVFAERRPDLPLFSPGRRLPPPAVRGSGRYELVAQAPHVELWVRGARLAEPGLRERLVSFYAKAHAADIARLRPQVRALPAGVEVLASSPLGPALKYLSLTGELPAPVRLVRPGTEAAEAGRLGLARAVTLDLPLPGYAPRELPTGPGGARFIENVRP